MSAAVMSSLGMAHFASEPLGKKGKLSHGRVCTLMLPHVMRFSAVANPSKFVQIAEMMGENTRGNTVLEAAERSVDAVIRLAKDVGMKLDLRDTDFTDSEIESMAQFVNSHSGHIINQTSARSIALEDIKGMYTAIIRGTEKMT
jgi:alcohol dehydrogenase class IV